MNIGNWRITTHSEFFPNNIHDQIAQRQRCEMEKRESEQQRKAMGEQSKREDAMLKPLKQEKAQCQESVYPEEEFKTHFALSQIGRTELRIKALELAIQEIDNMGVNNSVERERLIFNAAQRFYTYITKGA